VLTEPQLLALLLDLQQRFSWGQTASQYRLDHSWQSRTATLYRASGLPSGDPGVVLKVLDRVDGSTARALDDGLRRLGQAFASQDRSRARIPDALGWLDVPAAVCTRHVEGTDVIRLFADLGHPSWAGSGWDPTELASECGRALGVYHTADHPAIAPGEADGDLREAARAMRVSAPLLARLADDAVTAPTFGDFGPHQLMATDGGGLFLLDAPPAPAGGPALGDVARFLFGLDKALARNPGVAADRRDAFRDAFCSGYAEAGLDDPRTPAGRRLVLLYEGAMARGVARQRWSIGRRGEAIRYGRRWASTVRALRREAAR